MHFRRVGWRLVDAMEKRHRKVKIVSPTTMSHMELAWDSYMQMARTIIKDPSIDAICLLKGWEKSAGCILELMWARAAGLPIIYEAGAKHA